MNRIQWSLIIFQGLKYILIALAVSNLLIDSQPIIQQIIIQNIPQQSSNDYNLDSFVGLMFLQKLFIFSLAFIAHFIFSHVKSFIFTINSNNNPYISLLKYQLTIQKQNTKHQNNQSNESLEQIKQKPTINTLYFHQVWIGLVIFLSTYWFSQIQQKIQIDYMIKNKNMNIIPVFIFIQLFVVISKRSWKNNLCKFLSIQDHNPIFQLVKSLFLIVPLVYARIYYLQNQNLSKFYNDALCPYFCRDQKIVDAQTIKLFKYTIFLDYLMFGGLFFIKYKCNHKQTLKMLMSMTKFTALFFALYGCYTGQFMQTMSVVYNVPLILVPLGKLFIIHFGLYFLYAYLIANYSPLAFFAIFITRGYFKNVSSVIKQFSQKVYNNHFIMITIMIIISIQLMILKWIDYNRNRQMNEIESKQKISTEQDQQLKYSSNQL